MKRLFLILCLLAPVFSRGATVHFALTNFNVTTATNSIIITPTNGPVVNSPFLQVGNPIRITTTAGQVTTNLLCGTYVLSIYNISYPRPLIFCVPCDSGTYEITALLTNGFSFSATNPPFLTYPTNSGSDNQVASKTGDKTKWVTQGAGSLPTFNTNQFGSANGFTNGKASGLWTNEIYHTSPSLTNVAHFGGTGDAAYDTNFYYKATTNLSSVIGNGTAASYPYYTNVANNRWLILDAADDVWVLGTISEILLDTADAYSVDLVLEKSPWNSLTGDSPFPLVHYFNPAIEARLGVIAGDGQAVSNLLTANLVGAIGASLLPYARTNADGIVNSNDWNWIRTIPGQQRYMERVPMLAVFQTDEGSASNAAYLFHTGQAPGFNRIETEASAYQATRVVGALSPFGVTTHLAFNTTYFPSGLAGFKDILRTNGCQWIAWYDHIHAANGTTSFAQKLDDIWTIGNMGPGAIWSDDIDPDTLQAFSIVCTNNNIQLFIGLNSAVATNSAAHTLRHLQMANGFMMHPPGGDITSWGTVVGYADEVENYWWKIVGPGCWMFHCSTALGTTPRATYHALQSMFSGAITPQAGATTDYTAFPFRWVQQDPAVVCARRVLTTNNIWCYLKPLRTPSGPDFALLMVNTNDSTAKSATVPWNALNQAGQQSSLTLNDATYSVYDRKANATVGDAQSQIVVTSLASHDYAIFELISTNRFLAGDASRATSANATTLFGSGTVPAARLPVLNGITSPGSALTNGNSFAATVSNQFRVDVTHAFVASNATSLKLAAIDGANQLTNATVGSGLSLSAGLVLTATGGGGDPASYWRTNGNSGLPGNSFVGTTDQYDLTFRVDNDIVAQFIETPSRHGIDVRLGLGHQSDVTNIGGFIAGATNFNITSTPNVIFGWWNSMSNSSYCNIVSAGYSNVIAGSSESAVLAGFSNIISNSANAEILGGRLCYANGNYTLAEGDRAKAIHTGAKVFADSQNADFSSAAADTFNVRAQGGALFELGTSTFTNRGSMQVTNSLVVGTNGPIHSTNNFQVASTDNRKAFEVNQTVGKIFANMPTTFTTSSTNRTLTANSLTISGAGGVVTNLTGSATTEDGNVTFGGTITGNGSGVTNQIRAIGITIDGGGSAITTGVKGYIEVPYGCAIQRVTMLADQSGSAVVDIWKDTYANYPPTIADTITASALPTISSATKSQDSTLTGWTKGITAGDVLGFNVNSATTITRLTVVLKVVTQ